MIEYTGPHGTKFTLLPRPRTATDSHVKAEWPTNISWAKRRADTESLAAHLASLPSTQRAEAFTALTGMIAWTLELLASREPK